MTVHRPRLMFFALLLIALSYNHVQPARILLMPIAHRSHVRLFNSQAKALVVAGHETWLMTTKRLKPAASTVKYLTFTASKETEFERIVLDFMKNDPTGDSVSQEIFDSSDTEGLAIRYCTEMIENEVMKTVEALKFDLVIIDAVSFLSCMYMVPYKFDIPHLSIFGFQTVSWVVGTTGMPSIEPEMMMPFSNRMNFWQRLQNLFVWLMFVNNPHSKLHSKQLVDQYMPEDKRGVTFDDIMRQSEMFLLNFEVMCLDYPRVSAPNYQFIGGSSTGPGKALQGDLRDFVEGAEHGVVVMSLGSLEGCQYIWKVMKSKLFAAFRRLQQRVVVQYTFPDKHDAPDNVLLMNWLPQNDLLGHPNTRLFITHGGNNGANEAVYHGVPMLVVPVILDQIYSSIRVETRGYGKRVIDKRGITADELYGMMSEIINNKTYTNNVKKCSAIIRSMPSAQEKLVFWVNHILRFGGAHLRPVSLDMPLYQVLMLDIVAFFLAIGMAAFLCVTCLGYYVFRLFTRQGKAKSD